MGKTYDEIELEDVITEKQAIQLSKMLSNYILGDKE